MSIIRRILSIGKQFVNKVTYHAVHIVIVYYINYTFKPDCSILFFILGKYYSNNLSVINNNFLIYDKSVKMISYLYLNIKLIKRYKLVISSNKIKNMAAMKFIPYK